MRDSLSATFSNMPDTRIGRKQWKVKAYFNTPINFYIFAIWSPKAGEKRSLEIIIGEEIERVESNVF